MVSEVGGSLSINCGNKLYYGSDFFSQVSVNNDGVIVEVHQSLMREVQHSIGRVNECTKWIDWWQQNLRINDGMLQP